MHGMADNDKARTCQPGRATPVMALTIAGNAVPCVMEQLGVSHPQRVLPDPARLCLDGPWWGHAGHRPMSELWHQSIAYHISQPQL